MKRIHAAALAAALAGTVPAWGQQPPTARPDVMTLTGQDGKPTHTCKVLRTYKHPAGGTAYEVKDETTGEIMTVVENASPDDVKSSLKPEVVTESTKPADPILQPKAYSGAKVQQQFGPDPVAKPTGDQMRSGPSPMPPTVTTTPDAAYTRPPVPATRRWFNWLRNDPPAAKPAAGQSSSRRVTPPALGPGEMMAVYHPDPVIRLIGSMTDDLLPSMREVSAEALVRDGKGRPEVVEALVRSARTDEAPSVRACCCRCLAELQTRSPEGLAALQQLAADKEQSVRTAAAAALAVLEQP